MEKQDILEKLLWWLDCHDQAKEDVIDYVGCNEEELQSLATCIVTNGENLDQHIHFNYYKDGSLNFLGNADGWTKLMSIFALIDNVAQEYDMNVVDIAEMYLNYKEVYDVEEETNNE